MEDVKAVVLEVKEGKGFENFRQDIVIQAELDGVASKTLPARTTRDGVVHFNNDFIWKLKKKCLRRMKICSTPLKIECYAVTNERKKTRIGYQSLKLKTFKEEGQCEEIKGEWLRLLGISSHPKQSLPFVFLRYYIQDGTSKEENIMQRCNELIPMEELAEIKAVLTSKKGEIQVGPVNEDTDCFILGVKLAEIKNLNLLSPGELGRSNEYVFLFTLLGYDIQRESFNDLLKPVPQEKMFIKLKSEMPVLRQYLETNPYLTVRLMDGDTVLGYSQVDLRLLLPEDGVKPFPTSLEKHLILMSPMNTKALEKNNEASVDLFLTFNLAENAVNHSSSASASVKTGHNLESIPEKEMNIPRKNKEKSVHESEFLTNKKEGVLSDRNACDLGDKISQHQNTVDNSEGADTQPVLNESLAEKVVKELEDWKEAQKELFIEKLKRKEKQHLDLLSSEWQVKREKLENNLITVISQNNALMSSLKDAISDLQERKKRVADKEKRINFIKEDVERRFNMKLQELQAASKRMEDDCNHKVEIFETQKNDHQLQYRELQTDNLTLKERVKELEAEVTKLTKGSLTKDQTASLLSEVKSLQEKLDISDQSKVFFKEQWAKAVREIHRLKTEHQESLQIQIKHNKEELRQLGLCPTVISDGSHENEEPRLPPHIQKLMQRRNEMNESGDAVEASSSKIRLLRTASVTHKSIANEKLQSLIEERNGLLRKGEYSIEDQVICDLNQQIRSLMTTCGDTG